MSNYDKYGDWLYEGLDPVFVRDIAQALGTLTRCGGSVGEKK